MPLVAIASRLSVGSPLIMIVPFFILLWPAERAVRRRYTKAAIVGDRLRYEAGMTSKSTRTIQLTKVQDVRVDQSMAQRIFNIGNISIETAGETSRLTIENVDDPQSLAVAAGGFHQDVVGRTGL